MTAWTATFEQTGVCRRCHRPTRLIETYTVKVLASGDLQPDHLLSFTLVHLDRDPNPAPLSDDRNASSMSR